MKTIHIRIIGLFFIAGFAVILLTNSLKESTQSCSVVCQLLQEDSVATGVLASYPDSVRSSALVAAGYPEVLVKMDALHQSSSYSFRSLLSPLEEEEEQLNVLNLARYEGLLGKIAAGGKKSKNELEQIALQYPQEADSSIMASRSVSYDILVKAARMDSSAKASFEELINPYPPDAQSAFRSLTKQPELVELLGGSMRMTVIAGDAYKKDPLLVNHELDSFNLVMAAERTKEINDWKKGLDENPEAKTEFEDAAKDFSKEQGGTGTEVITNQTVIVNYVYYPYSYWCGYPWWWNYPYWYPYPYWYYCGFYYSPYGVVYYGYPSPFFMHWYFHDYNHHYHYCHFSDYCIDHYYGHRRSLSGSDREIGNWIQQEQTDLPQGFFTKDAARPGRLQELGLQEINRADYNLQHPDKPMTRAEYINGNSVLYPDLAKPSTGGNVQNTNTNPPPKVVVPANPNTVPANPNTVPANPNTVPSNPTGLPSKNGRPPQIITRPKGNQGATGGSQPSVPRATPAPKTVSKPR